MTAADAAQLLAESTPGPWYIDPDGSRLDIHSDATYPGDPSDDGSGWTVAEVCGHPWWESGDVLLIAAAPDLARAVIRLEAERDAALRRGRMEGAEAGVEAGAAWSLAGSIIEGTRPAPDPAAIVAALEAEDAR